MLEPMGTKESGKIVKRIRILGAVKQFRNGRFNGTNMPVEVGKGKRMKKRGGLPKDEGDAIRECKAVAKCGR